MKIIVTGSSGMIGSELLPALRKDGHEVVRLVRRAARSADEASWHPDRGELDPTTISGADAVVNLSGSGAGLRRWTNSYKRTFRDSRVQTTQVLATAIAAADPRPQTFLSASAVGWYGDTGSRVVDETMPAGEGFLADVCRAWEGATTPAEDAGVRVVRMRTGLICAKRGGLLARMGPLFKLFVGGRLGSGKQYWPWVSMRDEIGAMLFLLESDDISGPVNLTGPEPVTNAEFTAALGEVTNRPTPIPAPSFGLRLALGEFADEALLGGQCAVPRVLTEHGYSFTDEDVRSALRWALDDK